LAFEALGLRVLEGIIAQNLEASTAFKSVALRRIAKLLQALAIQHSASLQVFI
jgi:hypothetical protein